MQILAEKSQQIAALCRSNHIARLSVFGSTVRGDHGLDSDIDLLVEFERGQAPSLAGKRIDLAAPGILRNPHRRKAVLADLKELYAS